MKTLCVFGCDGGGHREEDRQRNRDRERIYIHTDTHSSNILILLIIPEKHCGMIKILIMLDSKLMEVINEITT